MTKVGVIPEDWREYLFSDIFIFSTGKNIKQDEASVEFDIPCVRYGELYHMYNEVITKVINKTNLDKSELLFSKGDEILLPSAGEDPLDIGSASALTLENIAIGRTINILSPMEDNIYSQKYVAYYINQQLKKKISTLAKGSSISNVYNSDLKKLRINLPPLKEQEKISNILITWDDTLSKQDELIEAKEELKKGLMQKLLSGKVRFNGFDNEWEEIKLKQLINNISIKNTNKEINLVLTVSTKHGFISQKDYFEREIASKDTSNYKIVNRGDFAYNPSRINIGSISYLEEFEKGILSPMYVIFKCNDKLESRYFDYWLNTHAFKGNLSKYLSGSVRDSLSFKDMSLMQIKFPSLQEQQKIVEFLTNVDEEIGSLKDELEELKLQKKGLMQKLLTGNIRVKIRKGQIHVS